MPKKSSKEPEINFIGLDAKKSKDLAKQLNVLLANFQVYYQNLRGLHWNIKGSSFFELHAKFEELYTDANMKVDEIAERILTLGEVPLHTFQDYLDTSDIKPGKKISGEKESVSLVVKNLSTLLKIERKAISHAGDLGDEGTVDLLSSMISEQEKTVWMLTSYLK
ncbi:DNA starvation/stationary phase protection protein [Limibacter armeniacum]|uniref:Dps family protein n=1 Tax=Limibacter armeniacum TaxID=466084 RepID=UPI002FE5C021